MYPDRHEPPDRVCAPNEFEVLYWKHTELGGHFTGGDGNGVCTFDPWGWGRIAREGTLVSKRIFRRVL